MTPPDAPPRFRWPDPYLVFLTGRYLGYPICCSMSFAAGRVGRHMPEDFVLYGTGFIPCSGCMGRSEEDLVQEIQASRRCPHPFPMTEDQAFEALQSPEFQRYLEADLVTL